MGDVTLAHNGAMSIPLQPVTSLRRPAQPNAPSASCWLRRVPDDGGRRVWTSPSCKGCRGRSQCPVFSSSTANRQGCMPRELDFNPHIHPIPTEKPVGIPQNPHIHRTQKSPYPLPTPCVFSLDAHFCCLSCIYYIGLYCMSTDRRGSRCLHKQHAVHVTLCIQ